MPRNNVTLVKVFKAPATQAIEEREAVQGGSRASNANRLGPISISMRLYFTVTRDTLLVMCPLKVYAEHRTRPHQSVNAAPRDKSVQCSEPFTVNSRAWWFQHRAPLRAAAIRITRDRCSMRPKPPAARARLAKLPRTPGFAAICYRAAIDLGLLGPVPGREPG